MKYSYAALGMVGIGLFAFAIVMVFQFITINNEADYYSLKEAMEASMYESIDWDYYTGATNDGNGELKIIKEKFVANFTRRFAKNTMGNSNGYVIEFYDIMEKPPKASIRIKNLTSSMSISTEDFTVVNELSGILEAKKISKTVYTNGELCSGSEVAYKTILKEYYSRLPIGDSTNYLLNTNTIKNDILVSSNKPSSVVSYADIKSLAITSIDFGGFLDSFEVNQGESYFAYGSPSNWKKVTNNPNVLSSFTLDSSCEKEFVSFRASVIDGRHDEIGKSSVIPSMVNDPVIIKVKIAHSNDDNNDKCDFGFKYSITWRYGYCK